MLPASRRRPSASPNMLDSIAAHHSVRRPNLRASLLRHRLPSKVHAELKRLLPPARVEYIQKQPTLEEVFLAIVGKKGQEAER